MSDTHCEKHKVRLYGYSHGPEDTQLICPVCVYDERARYKAALEYIEIEIQELPSGVDEDADAENQSPEDAAAHTGGLILRRIREVLHQPAEGGYTK